jgi:hypothetical protein
MRIAALLFAAPLALVACDRTPPPPPIATVGVTPAAAAPERVSLIDLTPKDGALPALLKRETDAAQKRGMKAVVEVGATWCKPCQAIRASIGDPLMVDAFHGVHVIRLDLDEWESQLGGVGITPGAIPAFFLLDGNGRAGKRILTGDAWQEDVPSQMAPKIKAFLNS